VDQKRKQRDYDRKRRKTHKQGKRRRTSLLYLLEKGLGQLQQLLDENPQIQITDHDRRYLRTIKKVLEQQTFLQSHEPKELKDRIVSLAKPYVRPIVRGKENKRVEFGMKAHVLQTDGISYFDCMNFNAFNETTRLKISVLKHKSLFGACHQLGADNIYPSNANRRYLTEKQIFTCFPKKGPKTYNKQETKLRSLISTARATVMEGCFGTHKTSYGLTKVKARTQKNEIVWVFFAVMTANAVLNRQTQSQQIHLRTASSLIGIKNTEENVPSISTCS